MIRLHRTLRNDHVRIFRNGVRHQEFELAGFVAARAEAGAIIPLHIDIRAAEVLTQAWHQFQWCWQMREGYSRKTG